jgi:membrane-associated protease RseP (regulator of RpoE activity)
VRKDRHAEGMMSLAGLRKVMKAALEAHKTGADRKPAASTPRLADSFESLPPDLKSGKNCMHCHQVWDHMRKGMDPAAAKKEVLETYPLPENLGFTLDIDLGNVVKFVDPKGPAAKAGLKAKDEVAAVNGTPVYSAADFSWALQNLKGNSIDIELAGKKTVKFAPAGDWRVRDITWRGSMWALRPATGFGGKQLDEAELKGLGLKPGAFAFKVNYIVDWGGQDNPAGLNAKRAGLQKGDIVVSAAGKADFATELDFQAWWRLNLKPGSDVDVAIFRAGKPM